jgi:Domain of unknown function (DUF3291)
MKWHIAQLNIARMIGKNIDDPVMNEFVAQLDEINLLAEKSEGFIWRLKSDDGNATSYNPYNDDRLIINFSVWENASLLKEYVYNSAHKFVMKDRKKWFENFGQPYYVLWHVAEGTIPSIDEAVERLSYLQQNGHSAYAFDFKQLFEPGNNLHNK